MILAAVFATSALLLVAIAYRYRAGWVGWLADDQQFISARWLREHGLAEPAAGYPAHQLHLGAALRELEAGGTPLSDAVIAARPRLVAQLTESLGARPGQILTFVGVPVLPVAAAPYGAHEIQSEFGAMVVEGYRRFCDELERLCDAAKVRLAAELASLEQGAFPSRELSDLALGTAPSWYRTLRP